MANKLFAKRATAFTFYVGLVDQSNTKLLKANPTLASGDAKVSKDGGAFANLTTLPDANPASGTAIRVQLSASEMTADDIVIALIDAAGAEWCDQLIHIQTVATGADWMTLLISDLLNTVNTGATFNVANSIGRQIRTAAGYVFSIRTGTLQSGSTSTTAKLDSGASATNNIYSGATITITGGTGVGQTRRIVTYVGSTKVATVDKAWVTTPDNTSTFQIDAGSGSLISNEGTLASATGTTAVLASTASTVDDTYNGGLITILAGTGAGQTREITDYTGSTKTCTVATWSVTPDNTSVYAVIPGGGVVSDASTPPTVDQIIGALMARSLSSAPTSGTVEEAFVAARAQGFGKWALVGTTLTLYASDGTTVVKQFTLDSATAPTSRTPV